MPVVMPMAMLASTSVSMWKAATGEGAATLARFFFVRSKTLAPPERRYENIRARCPHNVCTEVASILSCTERAIGSGTKLPPQGGRDAGRM